MHLNATYKNSWNRKQNKICVTLDSELYSRKPVLTYAISGNGVGGFGDFGEYLVTLLLIHGTYLFRLDKIHFNSRRTLGMLMK